MQLVNVQDLHKVYPAEKDKPAFTAVGGVSFEIARGEVLGLLGPNGAGKSTTIAMLLGVLTPTSGSISYFGKPFAENRSEILQSVTFASTYIQMPWRLTVWENLLVYGHMYDLSRTEFTRRAEKLLKTFDVWSQRGKTMNQLSAGQVTRVMLAKAFIPRPRVVLLDEPTASLDPDIAHQVRSFIKEQQAEYNTTILYTSHNMDEVADVCDRVVFLRKGKVVATDSPGNLARSISRATMRLVMVDGLKRTVEFAEQQGIEHTVAGREVALQVDERAIASILNKLAQSGIEYDQISIDKPTLEDYFLSMSMDDSQEIVNEH